MENKSWKLIYYRYLSKQEYKADTKEEALSFGCHSAEQGQLSMFELIDPEGNVNMNDVELSDYYLNVFCEALD